ncbi:arylsulfatase [Algoriphagus sp. CAU 1675]|uniref:arylsulfatase n=1 Tax=Algoriphagus sp. CAU 1675 TaxID=3032597 RepID=UPI0023DBBD7F|nr:arylsulfatase [Algoriphagus sp. CAU 1675]MDF2156752.1 arylsulfatase [Algoriphagus sp. CAU 1675]
MRKLPLSFFLLALIFSCQSPEIKSTNPPRPNILLIVADDLGYGDLGSFGGDMETPNLDRLAEEGIRFSQYTTAPFCAVSRAMMLSGNYNHVAGMGSQDLVTEVPGYEGHLSDRIVPIPELLQEAGYHTYTVGKWHLGLKPEDNPHQKGFEKSFVTLEGGANHYSSRGIFPEAPESPYTENGQKASWPEGAYSTDFYTDKLISYIESNREDRQPFFAFAAYTSPHWPLQVDEKFWNKYQGRYDEGYEVLRKKRLESLKKSGIIPFNAALPALHPRVAPWDSLTPEEQKKEARKMELYAGMVDNLDYNIGRLISYLKEKGLYENTLIVFVSDNGAAAEDFFYHSSFGPFLKENYTDAYEEMGTENSFISYGPQWAESSNAPFRYFKGYTTEGGMVAPMIISGPQVEKAGQINNEFVTVMDLAPTFYQLAGVSYPETWKSKKVKPLPGKSLLPLFSAEKQQIHDSTYVFALEHRGYVMVRKGDWKLVNLRSPFDPKNFELYNLAKDREEQIDLKASHPEKLEEMIQEWKKYAEEVGVVIPTPQAGG